MINKHMKMDDVNGTSYYVIYDTEGIYNLSSWMNSTEEELSEDLLIRKKIYHILMPIVLALCLVSFLMSGFVVCSTPYIKRPMSPTIRLSLSLSAANSAFSIMVFLGTVLHSYLPYVFHIHIPMCVSLTVEAFRMGIILVQVYHLLAVALIHYLGTLRPLQYAATLTPYSLKIIVFLLWKIPIVGIFIGFSSISGQGFRSEGCKNNYFRVDGIYFRYIWSLIYFGPTVVLILVYLHIFVILSRRGSHLLEGEHKRRITRNMKTVKTTALIVVTFLIGWGPGVMAFLLICQDCYFQITDIRHAVAIFSTTYFLIILKVFVDTFIYALRLPEIREALRILFYRISHCCLGSVDGSYGRRFRTSSTGSSNCRSTYLNSINSTSYGSHKDRSLAKTLSATSKSNVTVEMRPLFDKISSHSPISNKLSESTY